MPFLTLPELAIAFPNIDPVIFEVGPLAIRWYSLGYIVGIVFGWWYAKKMIRTERLWGGRAPMNEVDMDDFVFWATIGIVLGRTHWLCALLWHGTIPCQSSLYLWHHGKTVSP